MSQKGFSYEGNLPHQTKAVESVVNCFDYTLKPKIAESNPIIDFTRFSENVERVQELNGLSMKNTDEHIVDVQMETGTGKTYTYTKTMFELNKKLGLNKFIVVVPSLSIKAGTLSFLNDSATKQHFRNQYNREIKVFEWSSSANNKKEYMPSAVSGWVTAPLNNTLNILVVNSGMINATREYNGEKISGLDYSYDTNLFSNFSTISEAISSVNGVMIIDEPHKFSQSGKTMENLNKLNPQLTIKYGATFNDKFNNLVYKLSAVDAFNQSLVKGITVCMDKFDIAKKVSIKLAKIDKQSSTAIFEYKKEKSNKTFELNVGDSLSKIDNDCVNLYIDKINATAVLLSNGVELKAGDKINPYLFNQGFVQRMIQQSVDKHFEIERELMTKEVRIKPLTLFFIDDIESYRKDSGSGELALYLEQCVKEKVNDLLKDKSLTNEYRRYLEKSLDDLSLTHAGYFSKDNSSKDKDIQKEVHEILHDKMSLLDVDNPRRFIFSKWTLKEGWDNPNVFQITKLRTSGSETSKLQEVGRGLRIPVNEYMQRVDQELEQHHLYYRVDVSEQDFVEDLVKDINDTNKMEIKLVAGKKLTNQQVHALASDFNVSENELLIKLAVNQVIDEEQVLQEDFEEKLKIVFPERYLADGKVKNEDERKPVKLTPRAGKYKELQELWETINKKVILEYNISDNLLETVLIDAIKSVDFRSNIQIVENTIDKNTKGEATTKILESYNINTLTYGEFLTGLSREIHLKIETIHECFKQAIKQNNTLTINDHLNNDTIRQIKEEFYRQLLQKVVNKSEIKYRSVSNKVQATKFTDKNGELIEVLATDLGIDTVDKKTPDNYLFDQAWFDSKLEKENILEGLESVTVYTKIPKRSVQIPVPGGLTYSPDFAYVVEGKDGKKSFNLIVETKDKTAVDLSRMEESKLDLAFQYFDDINITFKRQMTNKKMIDIISEITKEGND